MKRLPDKRILAECAANDFVGRRIELDRLIAHAIGGTGGIVLLSQPSAGCSELLRQVYDRLFLSQTDVIPFYFEIRETDKTSRGAALRFLCEFLLQSVAFRRNDTQILDAAPEVSEIAELAIPVDGHWIDRLAKIYLSNERLSDDRLFIRNCLSAPLRAAAGRAPSMVMIDGLHTAARFADGDAFLEDVRDIFSRAAIPFVLAGLRRFLYARMPFDTMNLSHLSFEEAGELAQRLSARYDVDINDQTRDLIAIQLGGNIGHTQHLFATAAEKRHSLDSFDEVEKAYADQIFGGRISRGYDRIFGHIFTDYETRSSVLEVLSENEASTTGEVPIAYLKKHTDIDSASVESALDALNSYEIISRDTGSVKLDQETPLPGDYIRAQVRLEIRGESRALVVGEELARFIRRAPALMSRYYRRRSAIGLRELMRSFDGRSISPTLLDYGRFRTELKGTDDEKILKALKEDNERISLPNVVYAAHAVSFYPKLRELTDTERSAIAIGFETSAKSEQVAWLAAEIDAKLEATREVTQFWCDRLEMVAAHCEFQQFRIWLIAPEGFDDEALKVLSDRNAYGSSRKQVALLKQVLNAGVEPAGEDKGAVEYEIVVPMGDDTEMIAAHTIEDIARRHNFPPRAINQIKTALVEACINANEHSLSPDRKIYQKFVVSGEKIVITVANRGVRLVDRENKNAADQGRRGWGLKLIQGLMDHVDLKQTDDGTILTMTKLLRQDTRDL